MERVYSHIEGLNPEQRAAVEHFEGPILVLAGAGSGKTRVLTSRIAHLIREHGVDPSGILAVTFTNKAAGEMRDRVQRILGHEPAGSWIGTFHAIGARLLRRHATLLGGGDDRAMAPWASNFSIYDSDAQTREVRGILDRLQLSAREWHPRGILSAISSAKNQFIDPEAYAETAHDAFSRVVADVYRSYQRSLRDQNAFDFDDLLVKPVELFRSRPALLEEYRARFPFILIDEYQDTNHVQYRLIKLLTLGYDDGPPADSGGPAPARAANLMVVGDDDQSIYGWRGADIRNILDFEKDFPDTRVIRLEQNYRSTSRILDAANHVISENRRRKGKTLRTDSGPGDLLTLVDAADEEDEAAWIAGEILARLEAEPERRLRDFVVLYRTNAQSRALEDALLRQSLPYQIVGGTRFYERREVVDLIAYLRLISNPRDGGAFDRIVNYPRRGIGDTSKGRVLRWADDQGMTALEAAHRADECEGLTRSAVRSLTTFADLIERYRELARNLGIGQLLEELIAEIGIRDALLAEGAEGEDRIANVEELVTSAYNFESVDTELLDEDALDTPPLDLFLQKISLIADLDRHDAGVDSVTLMTLHNAKGLEYPTVFISGLEEGLFPLSRSFDDPETLEEERRLFYVGITRARQKLYLVNARSRRRLGTTQHSVRSSFLEPIPAELLEERRTPKLNRAGGGGGWGDRWDRPFGKKEGAGARGGAADDWDGGLVIDYSDSQEMPRFIKGEVVRHPTFGRGVIRELAGFGIELKATIEFESVGRKKVVVQYANLQKEL